MHRPVYREPELIPAWDPRWDDVTAYEELELELTASDVETGILNIHQDFGTLSPVAAAPERAVRPVRQSGPNFAAWLAAFAFFLTGSSLVISGGMFAAVIAFLVVGTDIAPNAQGSVNEVTLASATPMAAATPAVAPAVKKNTSKPAAKKKKPVRRRSSTTSRTRASAARSSRKTAASNRVANKGEEVVEMSISQLRNYLSTDEPAAPPVTSAAAYTSPPPAPAPTPTPAYRAPVVAPPPPAPAPVAAPIYKAPAPAPARAPTPPPTKRPASSGGKIVLYDGYAPLDPVTVTVAADAAGVQVVVDGQSMGAAPLKLRMEPGSHHVAIATAKGAVSQFDVAAGEGDAWCFSTKGGIKPISCKKLK